MTHPTPLSTAFALTLAFMSLLATGNRADAQGVVERREPKPRHVEYSRQVGSDLGLLIGTVQQVRVIVPQGAQDKALRGSGTEVIFRDLDGTPVIRLERFKFESPEQAQRFFEVARVVRGSNWVFDLRGEWFVRASGPALADPAVLERTLNSAWARGPKTGKGDARLIGVGAEGFVFEDRIGLETFTGMVDRRLSSARLRSLEGGLGLVEGEIYSKGTYTSRVGEEHLSFEKDGDYRRGWIGTPAGAETLEAYAERFRYSKNEGVSGLLGRIFR